MKKILLTMLMVAMTITATQLIAGGRGDKTGLESKAAVCHYVQGTPISFTLWVPEAAVEAHLAHGDYTGECEGE